MKRNAVVDFIFGRRASHSLLAPGFAAGTLLLLLPLAGAFGQEPVDRTVVWAGGSSGAFDVPGNWNPQVVPEYSDDYHDTIRFQDAGEVVLHFNQDHAVRTLEFLGTTDGGGVTPKLTLALAGHRLTLNAQFDLDATAASGVRELVIDGGEVLSGTRFQMQEITTTSTKSILRLVNGALLWLSASGTIVNDIARRGPADIIVESGSLLRRDSRMRLFGQGRLTVTGPGSHYHATFAANTGGIEQYSGSRLEIRDGGLVTARTARSWNETYGGSHLISGVGLDDADQPVPSKLVVETSWESFRVYETTRVEHGGQIHLNGGRLSVRGGGTLELDGGQVFANDRQAIFFNDSLTVFYLNDPDQEAGLVQTGVYNGQGVDIREGAKVELRLGESFSAQPGDRFKLIKYPILDGQFAENEFRIGAYRFMIDYNLNGESVIGATVMHPHGSVILLR